MGVRKRNFDRKNRLYIFISDSDDIAIAEYLGSFSAQNSPVELHIFGDKAPNYCLMIEKIGLIDRPAYVEWNGSPEF